MLASTTQIIVVATDHVGNSQPLDPNDNTEVFYVVSCPGNCENHGVCQPSGQCLCHDGFHGEDCSSNSTVVEPPTLDFSFETTYEDAVMPLYVSANPSSVEADLSMAVTLSGFPSGSVFSSGVVANSTLTLRQDEFGEMQMTPLKDFSGHFTMTITAIQMQGADEARRQQELTLSVIPVADTPTLNVTASCEQQSLKLTIRASSTDVDGSENILVHIENIPSFVTIAGHQHNSSLALSPGEYPMTADQTFDVFMLNVTALSTESGGQHMSAVSQTIEIQSCYNEFTTPLQPTTTKKKKKSSADSNFKLSLSLIIMSPMFCSLFC